MAVVKKLAAIPFVDNIASPFSLIVIRRIQDYLQQFNHSAPSSTLALTFPKRPALFRGRSAAPAVEYPARLGYR